MSLCLHVLLLPFLHQEVPMHRLSILCVALFILGSSDVTNAQDKKRDGKDDVVGARWEFEATYGEEVVTGTFRVYRKEVFLGGKKVGTVEPSSPTETKLVIDGHPKLNGTTVLTKTGQKPPIWRGKLQHKRGKEWKIVVRVKDR